uniref:Uncharacterized protein n=1 Tax=Arundo donax TaxID=35708 RepID=A0A0A9CUR0_ARUDO
MTSSGIQRPMSSISIRQLNSSARFNNRVSSPERPKSDSLVDSCLMYFSFSTRQDSTASRCCMTLLLSPKSRSRLTISYETFCFSTSGSSFRLFSSRAKTFRSFFTACTSSTGSASRRIRIDSSTLLICSSVYCTTSPRLGAVGAKEVRERSTSSAATRLPRQTATVTRR